MVMMQLSEQRRKKYSIYVEDNFDDDFAWFTHDQERLFFNDISIGSDCDSFSSSSWSFA